LIDGVIKKIVFA